MRSIVIILSISLFAYKALCQGNCSMKMDQKQLQIELDDNTSHNKLSKSLMNKKIIESYSNENLLYLLSNLQNRDQLNFIAEEKVSLKNVSHNKGIERVAYVNVINLQDDQGRGGLDRETFEKILLENTQKSFSELNLRFEICEYHNHKDSEIFSTHFNNSDFIKSSGLKNKYEFPDRINIFLAANTNGSWSCFPGYDYNHLVINTGQAYSDATLLAHELGHYFSLYHTFETVSGYEYVDGSNCATSGDLICDTAADRWDLEIDRRECDYFGSQKDNNGDVYDPPTENIMSYHNPCQHLFTPNQIFRMNISLLEDRYDVLRKCDIEIIFEDEEEIIVLDDIVGEDDSYNEMLEYLLKNFGGSNQKIELESKSGFGYAFESNPESIQSSISMLKKHNLFSDLKIKN